MLTNSTAIDLRVVAGEMPDRAGPATNTACVRRALSIGAFLHYNRRGVGVRKW